MNLFLLHLDAHALNENDITTGEHKTMSEGEKVLFLEALQVINPLISWNLQKHLNPKLKEKQYFKTLKDRSTEYYAE